MASDERRETMQDIVAEFRDMVHQSVDGIIAVKADVIADRIEAAWKREQESLLTKQSENVNSCSAVYTGENKGGNAAAMRAVLVNIATDMIGLIETPRDKRACFQPQAVLDEIKQVIHELEGA